MNSSFFEKIFFEEKIRNKIGVCRAFIQNNDLEKMALGTYAIDEKEVYVNLFELETQKEEERIWEAHRQYIDLHYVIQGEEQIQINHISKMKQGVYDEQEDYLAMTGEPATISNLYKGDFCLCFPFDAHKTGVKIQQASAVKKAVFKIKIN